MCFTCVSYMQLRDARRAALTTLPRGPLARARARRALRRAVRAPVDPRPAGRARLRAARGDRDALSRLPARHGQPLPPAPLARGRGLRPLRVGRGRARPGAPPLLADGGGRAAARRLGRRAGPRPRTYRRLSPTPREGR